MISREGELFVPDRKRPSGWPMDGHVEEAG